MSQQPQEEPIVPSSPASIEDLARMENATEIHDLQELAADIWDSDEELDAFLADLRASRRASLG